MPYVEDNITIENARIIFRNFAGKKSQYNREGDRNFNVIIPDAAMAQKLASDGWNIHVREPREEGEQPEYRLPVAVGFNIRPPKVVMVTKRYQRQLDESTISLLDDADIVKADMTLRPYNWEVKDRDGVKAYLKTLYVVVEEDEFADKYATSNNDVPFN